MRKLRDSFSDRTARHSKVAHSLSVCICLDRVRTNAKTRLPLELSAFIKASGNSCGLAFSCSGRGFRWGQLEGIVDDDLQCQYDGGVSICADGGEGGRFDPAAGGRDLFPGVGIGNENVTGGSVTIASQNNAAPAVFTNFTIENSSGLSFSHVELSTVGSSDIYYAFRVYNSQNISYDSVVAQGAVGSASGPDAFLFQSDSGLSVTTSSFSYLGDGMNVQSDSNVTISGNSFQYMESDGIDACADTNIAISNNTFTSFQPLAGDHPDCIQFMESNIGASSNVSITNNTYVRGSGAAVQGITSGEEMGLPYSNITISGNHILRRALQRHRLRRRRFGRQRHRRPPPPPPGLTHTHTHTHTHTQHHTHNVVEGYADQYSAIYMDSTANGILTGNTAEHYTLLSTVTGLTQSNNTTVAATSATTPPTLANPGAISRPATTARPSPSPRR